MRHAYAGRKLDWPGPDVQRPLNGRGPATAQALARLLTLFAPDRVVSATPVRCVQTIAPLADAHALRINLDAQYDEGADPSQAATALRRLASGGGTAVVCSQGKLIPAVLGALTARSRETYNTRKGAGWVLAFSDDELVAATPFAPDA